MLYGIVGERLEQITRRVPLDEPPPLPENARLSAIGKSIPRFDAVQKVTGRARYTFDVQLPGLLYARRVVSTVPHARVTSIDTSAAEKYPGVRAVHVLERTRGSAQLRDPNAEGRSRYPIVRYAGQPLAAVAAVSPRAAEAAVKLVKVAYEPLPHVTTLEEAMEEGSPMVFPGPSRPRRRAEAARRRACRKKATYADPTRAALSAGRAATSRRDWLRPTSLSTASTAPRSRPMSRWRRTALSPTGARTA
jgi:CO/xanthine dehydrogenase Mo-binding subunit